MKVIWKILRTFAFEECNFSGFGNLDKWSISKGDNYVTKLCLSKIENVSKLANK